MLGWLLVQDKHLFGTSLIQASEAEARKASSM